MKKFSSTLSRTMEMMIKSTDAVTQHARDGIAGEDQKDDDQGIGN